MISDCGLGGDWLQKDSGGVGSSDLGTVRNLAHYSELTSAQTRRLADVGFAVVPDDAEQMFNDLIAKGYQAFETSYIAGNPGRGKKITEFDETLQEIIMVPPIAGG